VPATIFLTGGGGFVGARLLDALARRGDAVVALDRSGTILRQARTSDSIAVVRGDLLDGNSYQDALSRCDIVVHLASSTGNANEEEHFRAIAAGTAELLDRCRRAGVRRFLYVSSIAASFADIRQYPYARAKLQTEGLVRASGLPFTIVRPTMILGPGSPILAALEKLALLPVVPVFGSGRTSVQPVFVDDVVQFILTILDDGLFANATFDVGGPEVVTIEHLLQHVRQARTGTRGRTLHVPLPPVLGLLAVGEAVGAGHLLPITPGQLSSFRFDGVVTPNTLYERCRTTLRPVTQMVSPNRVAAAPSDAERECVVFSDYLLGYAADAYVKRKYAEATAVVDGLTPRHPFDAFVLRFAAKNKLCTRLAAAYARVFLPGAVLHRKLILLLAILESNPPSSRMIDAPVKGPRALLLIRLGVRGLLAVLSLIAGTLVLAPARLAFANRHRRTQAALTHD
jgi:NADH dehydrogenase